MVTFNFVFNYRKELKLENTVDKIKPKPSVTAVIGGAWGDEGKGKIASREAKEALLVIRATGGANAGHTVVFEGKKVALHLVPGGIVYPHTICLIGQGVVIDLEVLIKEIEQLEKIGIPNVRERLKISGRAHVVLPYHKELDELHEMIKDNPVGTTKRGIGPTYSDKDNRIGIRVYDLLKFEHLENKIHQAIKLHNALFRSFGFSVVNEKSDKLAEKMYNFGKVLEPMIVNGDHLVDEFVKEEDKIVIEGAQAYRLDKDWGDYPDVTSSNCVTDGALIGGHLNHKDLKETIVVLKAYCSRVGNGPFPTELKSKDDAKGNMTAYEGEDAFAGDLIREYGHEYGTTTKRPRRTGWFDAVLVRSSKRALGPDYLCINHLDTLGKIGGVLGYVKICILYEYGGKIINYYPDDMEITGEEPKPIYWTLKGGWNIESSLRDYDQLPERAKTFIKKIEDETGIPVKFIGVGPDNEDLIVREDI